MSIFRSTGCVLLHVVFSTRCCDCGPKERVCSLMYSVCKFVSDWRRIQTYTQSAQDYTPAP